MMPTSGGEIRLAALLSGPAFMNVCDDVDVRPSLMTRVWLSGGHVTFKGVRCDERS
jgi:hypothetical protein